MRMVYTGSRFTANITVNGVNCFITTIPLMNANVVQTSPSASNPQASLAGMRQSGNGNVPSQTVQMYITNRTVNIS